ncbi:MAG TPA: hypothetical protein VND65_13560, partial [Candidatus Binatia bacterium]|nr:hypothetical protein [Candidatus Binatia bacterium]
SREKLPCRGFPSFLPIAGDEVLFRRAAACQIREAEIVEDSSTPDVEKLYWAGCGFNDFT